MQLVHGDREESIHRKYAAQRGIARCTLQLAMLQDAPVHQDATRETASLLVALAAHRNDLSNATRDEIQAEEDVGVIRALLRSKGFTFQLTRSGIPSDELPTHRDGTSDSEVESDSEVVSAEHAGLENTGNSQPGLPP
jgi:hypothetical protein